MVIGWILRAPRSPATPVAPFGWIWNLDSRNSPESAAGRSQNRHEGERASRANASENPTWTGVPSGRRPSRSNVKLVEIPDPRSCERCRIRGGIRTIPGSSIDNPSHGEVMLTNAPNGVRIHRRAIAGSPTVMTSEERAGNLDDVVIRAPRWRLRGANPKPERLVQSAAASRSRTASTIWSIPRDITDTRILSDPPMHTAGAAAACRLDQPALLHSPPR